MDALGPYSQQYHRTPTVALNPVRTVAPTDLLTLDEVKAHLRVDFADDDTLITAMRDAVTYNLDAWTGTLGRALLTQTWRADFHRFPWSQRLRLPLRPVSSITSIKYYDLSNAQQTLAGTVYDGPLTDALGAYAILKYGQTWPTTYYRDDSVSVLFVAGYVDAASVPAPIKAAAKLMIGDLYENRETVNVDLRAAAVQIPMSLTVQALLAPLRASWA